MPHEADVHAETAVYGGAIDAEKDPIRDGRPGRVLRIAIETHLKKKQQKNHTNSKIKRTSTGIADLKPDLVNQKPQTKISNCIKRNHGTNDYALKLKFEIQNYKNQTLFSDFALSFLNTVFLSVKPSDAIGRSNQNNK